MKKKRNIKIIFKSSCYLISDMLLIEKISTKKGIGRPKISEKTVIKIKKLFFNERQTYRQIAVECNVSLGTVHKYVKELIDLNK